MHLRIGAFEEGAAVQVRRQIEASLAAMGGMFRGLVLDLRDVAGGIADEAIGTADAFLEAGVITTKESRAAAARRFRRAPAT